MCVVDICLCSSFTRMHLPQAEFGQWIQSCYGKPAARTSGNSPSFTLTVTLDLDGITPISRLWVAEDLAKGGQRVRNFTVAIKRTNETAWLTVADGYSIGHKRIISLPAPITSLVAARVTLRSPGGGVYLSDFAAFGQQGCALSPDPVRERECVCVRERESRYGLEVVVLDGDEKYLINEGASHYLNEGASHYLNEGASYYFNEGASYYSNECVGADL